MLASESILNEPKSARLEVRTQPTIKKTIKKAAALSGVDLSTFIINTVYEAAKSTISIHELTILKSDADRDVFFDALTNPAKPTQQLVDAFALHQELVNNAD